MRVALNAWFLDQPGTGSGQYLRALLHAFSDMAVEHEFLVAVPRAPAGWSAGRLRARLWTPPAGPSPRKQGSRSGAGPWQTDLGKVLFEQVAFPWACRHFRAAVAHVPYWGSPLWPPRPTVVTIHDVIPLLLPAYRGRPLVRLYTGLVAASARRAAVVLTDSQASQRDIERHLHPGAGRVRCIYLAAGERFSPRPAPNDEAIRQKYGLAGRYALYLAGHDVRKNVASLLEAFAIVARADDDVTLVVGGRLPERIRGQSALFDPRPLATALGIAGRVRFVGWVDEAHKPALYRGAACAVFPSRYEGFGLPVLEALACGTPLVTSHTSSMPELLGDAGFAIDPDDVRGMAGAILSCLVDEALAAELRRRGPAQAAQFSWTRTAQETLAVYEEASRV